jgi:sulfotransferase family protein
LNGSGSRPIPVFVLGLQRSGTTWLANVLANHPSAVAVQAEDHFGIHESIFFSHFARAYGDLADDLNFRRFAAEFTTSDYYVLTGLAPDWLLSDRPRSYPEAFRDVMDEMARRRGGAQLWIEKSPTHTLLAEELAAAFPDARFVGIERRPAPVIASQLRLDGDEPPRYPRRLLRLLSMCLVYSLNQRWLARFCGECDRCQSTSYEALSANPAVETERICEFLGVPFTEDMLDLPWRQNTSFEGRDQRSRSLSRLDRAVIAAAVAALRLVPLSLLRSFHDRRKARHGIEWPDWCWRRRDAGVAAASSGVSDLAR